MNIRDLEYLVAVDKHKHFAKAAEACFVSQPTLSMQIKKLEDELGNALFERNNKQILTTDFGKGVIFRAKKILHEVNEINELAVFCREPDKGNLKLGAFPTLAPYFFPLVIPELSSLYEAKFFLLTEEKSDSLLALLMAGELDAILLASHKDDSKLNSEVIFAEPFYLAVYQGHPLAAQKSVSASDLAGQELLLLDEGHCLREQALEVCSLRGAHEKNDFRATSLETLRQMVVGKAAITLIPQIAARQAGLVYLPFKENPPQRTIRLYWRKSSAKGNFIRQLAQNLKHIIKRKLT